MVFLLLVVTWLPPALTRAAPVPLIQGGDSLVARNWTVKDGLPVNTVNNIIQDQRGYLWFTTYDGIVRFDGLKFKVFTHSNTSHLPQNRTVFIHEQQGSGIWVSLENGGVELIDKDGFHYFGTRQGFTLADVTYMFEDSHGTMWFGTYDGLFKYQDETFSRAFKRPRPAQNRISYITEDADSTIWAATYDGLVHVTTDTIKAYDIKPHTTSNKLSLIYETEGADFLIGSRTGLYQFENGQFSRPGKLAPLKHEYIAAVYEYDGKTLISTDRGLYRYGASLKKLDGIKSVQQAYQQFYLDQRGRLWMIQNNGKLSWLNGKKVVPFRGPEKIASFHFIRITEDREGNLWLTTARHGIVRLKHASTRMITKDQGLTGNNIMALFEDSRGRYWVGTRDHGLNIIKGDKVRQLREKGRLASNIVQSVAEDKTGNVWVGYYQQGLQKFTPSGDIESYDLGFDGTFNDVRAIYVSRDSTIWVGTYGGLIKLKDNGKKAAVYTTEDGLKGNYIRYIDGDNNGGLWIATADGGVSHFKDGSFTNYTVDQGLSSNNIRSVFTDPDDPNTVWVGTENTGLDRIRGDQIRHLGVKKGLPDHIIHYLSQDDRGWLWMSSNRGVFKIKKKGLNAFLDGRASSFRLVHYGREAGMINPECNGAFQKGGLRTSENTYWFATQHGVAVFKINPKNQNATPPPIYVTGVTADGRAYDTEAGKADIAAGAGSIVIHFQGLNFSTPSKTRYRYKLEGYDSLWNQVVGKRQAMYSDLPPGRYTFRVSAANSTGKWAKAATAGIKINPLFYQRPWFYVLLAFVLGIGFYGVSRVRYRYLMNKQQRLKQRIDEQTAKLRAERDAVRKQNRIIEKQAGELQETNKAKDRFFSIIGHDLRNPFQALVGYYSIIMDDYENMERAEIRTFVEEMGKATTRLLELVENLLSWASLQTGKTDMQPQPLALRELIISNIQLVSQSAGQKNITIERSFEGKGVVRADQNMISTVIRNLLTNAIKFTECGGKISAKLKDEGEICRIQIEDNGIGMSPGMIDKLMDLDANTSRYGTENESGTGLGLLICQEMINKHGGSIDVESVEGVGTTFTVTLTKNKSRSQTEA